MNTSIVVLAECFSRTCQKLTRSVYLTFLIFLIFFSFLMSVSFLISKTVHANGFIQIGTCHELYDAFTVDGWEDEDYYLTDDLDCTDDGLLAENAETELVGNDFIFASIEDPFVGRLQGGGNQLILAYSLSNTVELNTIALFRYASGGAFISNLDIYIDIDIAFDGNEDVLYIAGLVSRGQDEVFIRDISGSVNIYMHEEVGYDDTGVEVIAIGGLMGYCGYGCLFSNIELASSIDANFETHPVMQRLGGLAGAIDDGYADGSITISGAHIYANILANNADFVGGLVGYAYEDENDFVIEQVVVLVGEEVPGEIVGSNYVGGVVGSLESGTTLMDSYARIDVTAFGNAIGGLVGRNNSSNIATSYSTGDVSGGGTGVDIGGLVGASHGGSIESSFSFANAVASVGTHGGFIGWNNDNPSSTSILNSAWVIIDEIDAIGYNQGTEAPRELLATYDLSNFDLFGEGVDQLFFDGNFDMYTGVGNNEEAPGTYTVWDFEAVWEFVLDENDDLPLLQARSIGFYAPIVVTLEATDITQTSVTLNGEVIDTGGQNVIERGFDYGLTEDVEITVVIEGDFGVGSFTEELSELACGTTYYFRAIAENEQGIELGETLDFTTLSCPSDTDISTEVATNITQTTATLNSIIIEGTISAAAFFWGTDSYAEEDMSAMLEFDDFFDLDDAMKVFYPISYGGTGVDKGEEAYNHSENIAQLTCNTTYYYRSVAYLAEEEFSNIGVGDEVSFTTTPCSSAGDEGGGSRSSVSGVSYCTSARTKFCTQQPSQSQILAQTLEDIVNQNRDLFLQIHNSGIFLPQNILDILGVYTPVIPVRDLEYGMKGEDVRKLQELLISQGYSIPAGVTDSFLEQTRSALTAYQIDNDIFPAVGYFGSITRSFMKAKGIVGLWW